MTPTAREADIILPSANHMFEKWGYVKVHGNGYRHVTMLQPVIEPVWDVKTDETEIPWMLAGKLAERGFDNLLRHYQSYVDPETGEAPTNEGEFALYALKHATHKLWDPALHEGGDQFEGWEDFRSTGVWNSDPYPFRKRWGAMKTESGMFEFYSETLKKALTGHAEKHETDVGDGERAPPGQRSLLLRVPGHELRDLVETEIALHQRRLSVVAVTGVPVDRLVGDCAQRVVACGFVL